MKLTIIGAGAMGSALTVPLAEKVYEVRLCGTEFDESIITALKQYEPHPSLDAKLPDAVRIFDADTIDDALDGAELILIAVNSEGILPVMNTLLPYLDRSVPLITVAKGLIDLDGEAFCIGSGIEAYMRLKAVEQPPSVACLGGPSIASEIVAKTRTAVDLAATDSDLAPRLARAFSTKRFQSHAIDDLYGLEICLAFKNVYAIALAWPAGLAKEGASKTNLKAILFLQVLDELETIIEARGGCRSTARRFCGLGDLVATGEAGRNARFGRLLGSGKQAKQALHQMKSEGVGTVEGYEATRLGFEFINSLDDLRPERLPLLSAIHEVLYEAGSVEDRIDRIDPSALTHAQD